MDAVDNILAQWRKARPDLDVVAMGAVGRVSRIAHHFSNEMGKTFSKHGLNAAGFDVLATLRRTPPHALSAGELMASMMITSGTMTNRIDQLEKAGLVCRTSDPNDARKAVVRLTDQGQNLIDIALVDHVKTQKRLMVHLDTDEVETLNGLLSKLLKAQTSS